MVDLTSRRRLSGHITPRRLAFVLGCVMTLAGISLGTVTAAGAAPVRDAADTSARAQLMRPRPTRPPSPTPTVPPIASPTPTTAAGCDATVAIGDLFYCPGYLNLVQRTWYGTGQRIVLTVVVDGMSGSRANVHGGFYCPDGHYCGAALASGTITFPPGADVPAYGNIIQVFGVTTQGALDPGGFTVIGQCEPAWGDC